MHEDNLEIIKAKRKALNERQAEEKFQHEREIREREEELGARKKEL